MSQNAENQLSLGREAFRKKRDWIIVGILTLAAALLRFINLDHPGSIVFDETYFANFAHDYLTNTKFFDAEPPFGKFLIAGGEWVFGFNSFGWRVVPALFGTAIIPLMYLLAKRLFGGVLVPAIAGILALLDGLLLVESRVAVLDGFVVFFNLLTYTLFLVSLQASTRRRSLIWLGATGVSLGLGLSLKWITLAFIAPAIGLLLLFALGRHRRVLRLFKLRSRKDLLDSVGAKVANLHHPLAYLVGLGLVPLIIYITLFSFHVPFDSTGEGIWGIHKQIFNYHSSLKATHPYGSDWYTWPLLIRPVAYHFDTSGGQWAGIVALGNPLIWWAGLVGLGYTAYRFFKTRSLILLFILAGFVAHYAPWSVIGRVLFIYHYLGGLPFVMLALAYTLGDLWRWRPKDPSPQLIGWVFIAAAASIITGLLLRSGFSSLDPVITMGLGALLGIGATAAFTLFDVRGWHWGKKQAISFLLLAGLAFVYFYPIWTAIPLDPADYYRHMWLRSWI